MGQAASLDRRDDGPSIGWSRGGGRMLRGVRYSPARMSDDRRLSRRLDLSGDLISRSAQHITQTAADFGSGGGGVCIQQDRLGGGLREGSTDSENKEEQSYCQSVRSHGALHHMCRAKVSPEGCGSQSGPGVETLRLATLSG